MKVLTDVRPTGRRIWNRFRTDLGWIWNRFGISLGSVRDRFGVVLGSVWNRFELGLGSVWDRFEYNLHQGVTKHAIIPWATKASTKAAKKQPSMMNFITRLVPIPGQS